MTDNPYSPPPPEVDKPPRPATEEHGREVALYSPGQVVLAAFLGTPFAAAVVLAINYRRLGHTAAGSMVVFGALLSTLYIAVAMVLPRGVVSLGVNIIVLVGVYRLANYLQGPLFMKHRSEGGRQGSTWAVVGIAVGITAATAIVVALGYVAVELLSSNPPGLELQPEMP